MRGFTLLEVLVALFILSVVMTGVIFSISLNLASAERVKNNLIAANLVQEGLEIVRNIRDSDWHSGRAFGASLANGAYLVEWNSPSLKPFAGEFLKIDGNGFYNYTSGQAAIFKRKVIIENSLDNGPAIERVAKVEVSWDERRVPKTIQAELRLFNWK